MAQTTQAPPSLERETRITQLDPKTFRAHLDKSLCIGVVPNGGYVAMVFLRVASAYMTPRNQPDPINAHWEFLGRTAVGPAVMVVEESKMGRSMSVLHVSLYQDGLLNEHPWVSPNSRKAVAAYIINGRLDNETGVTVPTDWKLPYPPPPVDFSRSSPCNDPNWKDGTIFMRHVFELYEPQTGKPSPGVQDGWVRLKNGEPFTQSAIGLVIDIGPAMLAQTMMEENNIGSKSEDLAGRRQFWYPTIVMNVEFKKNLPPEGDQWLRLRVSFKMVKNGRNDVELIVFDRHGDVVALSNHVAMVVEFARNSRQRSGEKANM